MSAGAFLKAKYEASTDGLIHPIKIQPETETLAISGQANSQPTASLDSKISARVGGGNRQLGLKARNVAFRFVTAPEGYKQDSIIRVPWLRPDTYNAATIDGAEGSYVVNGTPEDIIVVGGTDENVK